MISNLTIADIKTRWNEVLDVLESKDRIAWLVFFDARLVSYHEGLLQLDFSDPNKFSGAHDYGSTKREKFRPILEEVLQEIFHTPIQIGEVSLS